jgi:hypothetical protein
VVKFIGSFAGWILYFAASWTAGLDELLHGGIIRKKINPQG